MKEMIYKFLEVALHMVLEIGSFYLVTKVFHLDPFLYLVVCLSTVRLRGIKTEEEVKNNGTNTTRLFEQGIQGSCR